MDYRKFRLLVRSGNHSQFEPPRCSICETEIGIGERYWDGGFGKRAHLICTQTGERNDTHKRSNHGIKRSAG
jgi:hypothetical protein